MSSKFIDPELILSENDQWIKLGEEWGTPIDLDTEDDCAPSKLKPVYSTLDLRTPTFSSGFQKIRKKVARNLSKKSTASILEYSNFIKNLKRDKPMESPTKQCYYINGQLLSAYSVEEICKNIDDIFKSIDKLCSATSTMRIKKREEPNCPEVVQCSISTDGLSFDDTSKELSENEKPDDEIDKYIDEALDQSSSAVVNKTIGDPNDGNVKDSVTSDSNEEIVKDSVTMLVKKFSEVLKSPVVKFPKKQRESCNKFKDLTDFWKNRAFADID